MEERLGMEELKLQVRNVIQKVDHLQGYVESEFGGRGLTGQPTEGNTTRTLREMNSKVILNYQEVVALEKRVKKIEDWKMYVLGGAGTLGIIFSFLTLAIQAIKTH